LPVPFWPRWRRSTPTTPTPWWRSPGRSPDVSSEGADAHIDALAKKYLGVDTYPMRKEGEVRLRITVRTDHIAMQG
jgi:hypothetical protein